MRREVYVIAVSIAILMTGFGIFMPFIPIFALHLGASAFDIGIMVSAFMIARIPSARYFGAKSDAIGRKKVMLLGLLGYTIVTALIAYSRNIRELILWRTLQGVASGAFRPAAQALVSDSVLIHERARAVSLVNAASTTGMIAGPALGGVLYHIFSAQTGPLQAFRYTFLFTSLISAITLIFVALFVQDVKAAKRVVFVQEVSVPSIARVIFTVAFANGLANGMVTSVRTLLLYEYFKASPEFVSALFTVLGVINAILAYPAGYLADHLGRKTVIMYTLGLSRIFTLMIPFLRDLMKFVGVAILRSAAFALGGPAYRAISADLFAHARGKLIGSQQARFNAGSVIGPLIGTRIYEKMPREIKIRKFIVIGKAVGFRISGIIGLISLVYFLLKVPESTSVMKEE